MLSELELYNSLDALIPENVDRTLPEIALEAGEIDSAIADLLTEANVAGLLEPEVFDLALKNTSKGSVLYGYLLVMSTRQSSTG